MSIDCSRCSSMCQYSSSLTTKCFVAYVEAEQLAAVLIELLVIEWDEVVYWGQAWLALGTRVGEDKWLLEMIRQGQWYGDGNTHQKQSESLL